MSPINVKLLAGVIADEMYNYLEREKFFQKNKKHAKEEVVEQKINY